MTVLVLQRLNLSPEEVQERILSVAASARSCYAPDYIIEEYLEYFDLQGMDTADDEGSTGNDDDDAGGTGNRWRTSRSFSSFLHFFVPPLGPPLRATTMASTMTARATLRVAPIIISWHA